MIPYVRPLVGLSVLSEHLFDKRNAHQPQFANPVYLHSVQEIIARFEGKAKLYSIISEHNDSRWSLGIYSENHRNIRK